MQWPDGGVVAQIPLGRGATYAVESRMALPDAAQLRAAADRTVPPAMRNRYAEPPPASDRTRELARRITAGATTDYDRVRAVERWLGENTRYSLDAPLSPSDVDVVDHFLFTSRLGWCEQVSSSMVVLLRTVGVPARLAAGFVPGERDPISGRFTVRERDAHAWTEVWFAGVGWVPFDPTAEVPLAGEDAAIAGGGSAERWLDLVAVVLVATGLGLVALDGLRALVPAVVRRFSRLLGRSRRGRAGRGRRIGGDAGAEERLAGIRRVEAHLEEVAAPKAGPRGPQETVTAYAARADRELAVVGAAADAARYGASEFDEAGAHAALDRLVGRAD